MRPSAGGLPDGYGVDDRRAFAGRELEQVDSIDESMEAGALGVQRDASRFDRTGGGVYRGEKGVDGFRRVEIDGRMHAGNLTGTVLPLIRRYPSLVAVPRVVLSRGPTPVEHVPSVHDNLWIKRDDVFADPMGGNKVRALEFLLGNVLHGDLLVTVGSAGSTHVLAVATYGRRLGAHVAVGRWRQVMNPTAARIAELDGARRRRSADVPVDRRRVRVGVAAAPSERRALDRRRRRHAARRTGPRERRARAGRSDRRRRAAAAREGRRSTRHRRDVGRARARVRDRRREDRPSSACASCRSSSGAARARDASRRDTARLIEGLAQRRVPRSGARLDVRRARRVRRRVRAGDRARERRRGASARRGRHRARRDVQAKAFQVALDLAKHGPTLFWLTFDSRVLNATALTMTETPSRSHVPHLPDRLRHARASEPRDDAQFSRARAVGAARAADRHPKLGQAGRVSRWCGTSTSAISRSRCPGEDLVIRSGLLAIKRTSYIIKQEVRKVGSNVLVADASIVFVAINQRGEPVPVPDHGASGCPPGRSRSDRARRQREHRVRRRRLGISGCLPARVPAQPHDVGPANRARSSPSAAASRSTCAASGESPPTPPYSMDRFADDVAGVLDTLQIERAVIVGLSIGGYIAFALWRRHRHRIRALVLADTRVGAGHRRAGRAATHADRAGRDAGKQRDRQRADRVGSSGRRRATSAPTSTTPCTA